MEEGAGLIIINNENKILLLLRDDIPEIPFPGKWDLPGGHMEKNETPSDTVKRELMEELGITVDIPRLFKRYLHKELNVIDNVFWVKKDLNLSIIDLKEGQDISYHSRDEISRLELAFNYNAVLEEFFISGVYHEI